VPNSSAVTELRDKLSEIIETVVVSGEEWVVTKHGRPIAVILGVEEYESLIESLNILSDDATMSAVREGLSDLESGDLLED
jgi:prevent-host-death family protein